MSNKSIQAWTSIAMLAIMSHFSAGAWTVLLILIVIGYCILKLAPEDFGQINNNPIFCIAQLIGIYLLISQLIPCSAQYWPGRKAEIVIPITLLLLAIYGCGKRPERVAGILFWAMVILFVPVMLAGGKDVQTQWIIPERFTISVWVVPALLMPILTGIATGLRQTGKWYVWTVLSGIGIWIIVHGVQSQSVAEIVDTPFRNMGQTLSIGPYSRFEAIVSVIATLGWFGFISLALYCADQIWKRIGLEQKKSKWIHAILLLTMLLLGVKITPAITVAYIIFVWVLLPAFGLKKISKKSEKSP